jgi:apolipoprotein N-acyltransferase
MRYSAPVKDRFYTRTLRQRQLQFGVLLTVSSGVLFGLAFPPTGWKPLAWLALAPFLVALRRGSLAQALLLTWLWCLVASYVIGDWFPRAIATYFHQPMLLAVAFYFGVFTLMAGPYYMAFAWAYRALARRYRLALPFLAGAAWAAAEMTRGRLFSGTPFFIGNPWGLIGYSQTDWLPVVQVASLTGIYGVSFAVVCVNAGLAELWLARRDGAASLRRAAITLGLAVLPAAGSLAFGALTLSRADQQWSSMPATRVAIAQGNIAIGSRWRSDLYGQNLEVYLRLTLEASRDGSPATVFWPESAMTFFLEREPAYRKAIARVLQLNDVEIVAGGPRAVGDDAPVYFNSIYTIDPDGAIGGRYDKQHLVPFAEYFPLRIDLLERNFGRVRSFESGTTADPIPTRAGPAGVVVCNETMLPEVVAERVDHGAVYLLNPSNDSWIRDEKYVEQQFDIAVMRAIEQRRTLVRVSTSGPSAVIDPWGRAPTRTTAGGREVLSGEVRTREDRSVYGRVGDLFSVLCIVAVAVALGVPRPPARPDSRTLSSCV